MKGSTQFSRAKERRAAGYNVIFFVLFYFICFFMLSFSFFHCLIYYSYTLYCDVFLWSRSRRGKAQKIYVERIPAKYIMILAIFTTKIDSRTTGFCWSSNYLLTQHIDFRDAPWNSSRLKSSRQQVLPWQILQGSYWIIYKGYQQRQQNCYLLYEQGTLLY